MLLFRSVLILIFSVLCLSLTGQNKIVKLESSKSIRRSYQKSGSDIRLLLDSAEMHMKLDRNKAFQFLEQAYLIGLRKENSDQQYLVYIKLGDYYKYHNQPDLAAKNYHDALMSLPHGYNSNLLLLNCGEQYLKSGQPRKSISVYNTFTNLNKYDKLALLEAYGDAYLSLQIADSAMMYYKHSEAIAIQRNNVDKEAELSLKMARVSALNNDGRELELISRANTISRSNTNAKIIVESQAQLADYYEKNSRKDEEISSRNRLIKDLDENKYALDSAMVDVKKIKAKEKVNLAQSYNYTQQFDKALEVLNSIELDSTAVQNKEDLEIQKEAAKTISEVHFNMGNEKLALASYEKYAAILDRLYKESENEYNNIKELNNQLRNHQGRIDFLEKDKLIYDAEMEMVEQEGMYQKERIRYQKWYIVLLMIVLALLMITLVMIIIRYRIQRKHNNYLALKSLRVQMNPHFIFNALNSINNFIVKNDERNANKYLARFSRLMRSILNNSELDFIPLEKEIEILELYLQLENVRFSDKFSYSFEVAETVDIDAFQVPPMLIQPYIENAVWHGLRYKEEGGYLKVEIKMEEEFLKVLIEDNGIGRKKSLALKTKNQKDTESKGIKTTTERLRILGEMYKKDIRSKISDLFENGEGTRVELWLPNIKADYGNKSHHSRR